MANLGVSENGVFLISSGKPPTETVQLDRILGNPVLSNKLHLSNQECLEHKFNGYPWVDIQNSKEFTHHF